MKKSLLALAVLGAFAGAASAQSSVTLYGTVDLSAKYVKNDGSDKRLSLSQDGINSSQLGFRGIEDLGGGLKAGFVLLAGVNADTGTANSKFWNRRSTLSLYNNMGELRLGRDYTPTFWTQDVYDPFGTNGLGSNFNVAQFLTSTAVRADNSIGYFLPSNLGGFYGQAMVAAGEGGVVSATAANPGRYIGGRIGFAAGPIDVSGSYAQQKYDFPIAGIVNPGGSVDTYNIGGQYDFGFLKLSGFVNRDKADHARETRGEIGAIIPMGQGEVHLGYHRSKLTNDTAGYSNTVSMIAATYQYNLSKRTAMYVTVADLRNGDHSVNSISGGTTITAAPTLGGSSKGFELGVRHFF
jgi:predicted porin